MAAGGAFKGLEITITTPGGVDALGLFKNLSKELGDMQAKFGKGWGKIAKDAAKSMNETASKHKKLMQRMTKQVNELKRALKDLAAYRSAQDKDLTAEEVQNLKLVEKAHQIKIANMIRGLKAFDAAQRKSRQMIVGNMAKNVNAYAASQRKITAETTKQAKAQAKVAAAAKRTANTHKKDMYSMFSMKLSLKSMVKDAAQLAMFQLRWYGARGALFALVGIPKTVITSYAEWEQAMKNASAVSTYTAGELKKLEEVTKEIGRTTPISAKDAAEALLEFAQAGISAEIALEALPAAAKMVVATQEDMKSAVSALTTAYYAWGLTAEEVPEAAGAIAAAMADSSLKVEDLSTVFNYLASQANLSNLSLQDTLTIMTALSKAGVKASTIGTGLSQALIAFTQMSPRLTKQIKSLGLTVEEVQVPHNNFLEVLKKLKKAGFDLTDVFKGLTARAGRSIGAVMNQAIGSLDQISGKIKQKGILDKMFGEAMEGVSNQAKLLKNAFINIAIAIGQDLAPAMQGLLPLLKGVADSIEIIVTSSEVSSDRFKDMGGGVKALVGAIMSLKTALDLVVYGVMNVIIVLSELQKVTQKSGQNVLQNLLTGQWGKAISEPVQMADDFFENLGKRLKKRRQKMFDELDVTGSNIRALWGFPEKSQYQYDFNKPVKLGDKLKKVFSASDFSATDETLKSIKGTLKGIAKLESQISVVKIESKYALENAAIKEQGKLIKSLHKMKLISVGEAHSRQMQLIENQYQMEMAKIDELTQAKKGSTNTQIADYNKQNAPDRQQLQDAIHLNFVRLAGIQQENSLLEEQGITKFNIEAIALKHNLKKQSQEEAGHKVALDLLNKKLLLEDEIKNKAEATAGIRADAAEQELNRQLQEASFAIADKNLERQIGTLEIIQELAEARGDYNTAIEAGAKISKLAYDKEQKAIKEMVNILQATLLLVGNLTDAQRKMYEQALQFLYDKGKALEKERRAAERATSASKKPFGQDNITLAIEAAIEGWNDWGKQVQDIIISTLESLQQGLASVFKDFLLGQETDFAGAIKGVSDTFLSGAADIASKQLTTMMFEKNKAGEVTGLSAVGAVGMGIATAASIYAQAQAGTLTPAGGAVQGGASGMAIGAYIGSVYPGIGTVVGAVIGLIVGAIGGAIAGGTGGGEKTPKVQVGYLGDIRDPKYGSKREYGDWRMGAGGSGSLPDFRPEKVIQEFVKWREKLILFVETIGLSFDRLDEEWASKIRKVKTGEQFAAAVEDWMEEYFGFTTYIDLSSFKMAGETIAETAQRMVDSVISIGELSRSAEYLKLGERFPGQSDAVLEGLNMFYDPERIAEIYQPLPEKYDLQKVYDEIQIEPDTLLEGLDKLTEGIYEKLGELPDALDNIEWGEKIGELGTMIADRYAMEIAYLTSIKALAQSISEAISGQIESYEIEMMSPAEQADHYNTKINELYAELASATDPARIEEIVAQIRGYVQAGWDLLSPEEKAGALEQITTFLKDVNDMAQGKLTDAVNTQIDTIGKLAIALGEIDWSPLTQLSEEGYNTAQAMAEAAEAARQLARDLRLANPAGGHDSGGGSQGGLGGGWASGLDYVPYDNFKANLHRGEAVITARGNRALSQIENKLSQLEVGGGVSQEPITIILNGDAGAIIQSAAVQGSNRAINMLRRNPRLLR